jgi:CheY-like chemotaxis protein
MKKLNLIIDDDEINNMFCKFIVSKVGFEGQFMSFTNPEEGLKFVSGILSEKNYDKVILFLDINMPIMNGWDFLKEFEKIYKNQTDIHIYILSSSISDEDMSQARANKLVKDFISKPLTVPVLGKIKESFAA